MPLATDLAGRDRPAQSKGPADRRAPRARRTQYTRTYISPRCSERLAPRHAWTAMKRHRARRWRAVPPPVATGEEGLAGGGARTRAPAAPPPPPPLPNSLEGERPPTCRRRRQHRTTPFLNSRALHAPAHTSTPLTAFALVSAGARATARRSLGERLTNTSSFVCPASLSLAHSRSLARSRLLARIPHKGRARVRATHARTAYLCCAATISLDLAARSLSLSLSLASLASFPRPWRP